MREIIATAAFNEAVEHLGGYRLIDMAMEAIVESLYRDPYGFEKFENDWCSFRFAKTKRIGVLPPFVVVFTINPGGNVILEHIEEDEELY